MFLCAFGQGSEGYSLKVVAIYGLLCHFVWGIGGQGFVGRSLMIADIYVVLCAKSGAVSGAVGGAKMGKIGQSGAKSKSAKSAYF